MAIDEAITIIKAYRERLTDSVSTLLDGDIEAFDMAVEAMGQTRWIPVSEKMPDTGEDVLYCDVNGNGPSVSCGLVFINGDVMSEVKLSQICKYSGLPSPWQFFLDPTSLTKKQIKDLYETVHLNRIVAWMPLPKRYEPQERSGA